MKIKFALALVAALGFAALPSFAQHGHGGSGGSSMHGDSHGSSGHDATEENHGRDGDHNNDANEHSGKHGAASGHDSGHGSLAAKLARNPQLASNCRLCCLRVPTCSRPLRDSKTWASL